MSDIAVIPARHPGKAEAERRVARRYRAERRFRFYGIAAIGFAALFLVILFADILSRGIPGFFHHRVGIQVTLDPATLDIGDKRDPDALRAADYRAVIREALQALFPDVTGRAERRQLAGFVATNAGAEIARRVIAEPYIIGSKINVNLPVSAEADLYYKGKIKAGPGQQLSAETGVLLDRLRANAFVSQDFAWNFLENGASREPEQAGILAALVGSALTMLVTLLLCLPTGVAAAIYLEEFAPKNRLTDIIEVNINNLAAVPSIIFGLLGLAVFLAMFGMPRSSSLVGGLVLALLVLPTIIIASRAALKAVPPSIREAALGIGASRQQAIFHHVLPLAMPGILTGTIIGMAHALGETAPLLLIGMVAFIVDVPGGVTDAATVLPVQIYQWSTFPEAAFQAKTAAGIIVLLVFLFLMNGAAILLRKRFERRW